jgi:hypothetical protein
MVPDKAGALKALVDGLAKYREWAFKPSAYYDRVLPAAAKRRGMSYAMCYREKATGKLYDNNGYPIESVVPNYSRKNDESQRLSYVVREDRERFEYSEDDPDAHEWSWYVETRNYQEDTYSYAQRGYERRLLSRSFCETMEKNTDKILQWAGDLSVGEVLTICGGRGSILSMAARYAIGEEELVQLGFSRYEVRDTSRCFVYANIDDPMRIHAGVMTMVSLYHGVPKVNVCY